MRTVQIDPSWQKVLAGEFGKPYFRTLRTFVRNEYETKRVYPPPASIFAALNLCPFDQVRVVILGQDPYHGPKQAHGLAFSVPHGVRQPPSLQNILKEIRADVGESQVTDDLSVWAKQGVLLLNATLTVLAGQAGSHQGRGWEQFTDAIIQSLSEQRHELVFMLWGNYARKKGALIDREKHLILEAAHPSPLSAHSGFFGCKHFSKANAHLTTCGHAPIVW